jgi:hypothetical protein
MDFGQLEALRRELKSIDERHVESLRVYAHPASNGFAHRIDGNKLSIASTATCVLSLVAARRWIGDWRSRSGELAGALLHASWSSAGLDPKNAFTTAFLLEAMTNLEKFDSSVQSAADNSTLIVEAEDILIKAIENGSATIGDYPPSAYMTQLVSRVLIMRNKLVDGVRERVLSWSWNEIAKQIALLAANSKTADPFQLAYASILTLNVGRQERFTPDDARILHAAIAQLFSNQRPDGSWPRSRPLFHYKNAGSAYCYEYEMLVQLLQAFRTAGLSDRLLLHLENFERATLALKDTSHRIGRDGLGWSSGHLPQKPGPESWATASVYHFAFELQRLIAEGIRRAVFTHLDNTYKTPGTPKSSIDDFAPDSVFLDSVVYEDDSVRSLRETIYSRFLKPISQELEVVRTGGQFSKGTPMSAILFGPPGTSKTQLAKLIADFLGWPLLSVDPSHVVRNGMDKIQAEADKLFGMLSVAEEIVVLLDEFDEMVREREVATDLLSRFLTTAMLPKLAAINRSRRIVFLLATNHIDNFDLAASRRGRFDMIVQVMPPTLQEKLRCWPSLKKAVTDFHIKKGDQEKLANLTYDECEALAGRIASAREEDEASKDIEKALERSTLQRKADPKKKPTWAEISELQRKYIRIP